MKSLFPGIRKTLTLSASLLTAVLTSSLGLLGAPAAQAAPTSWYLNYTGQTQEQTNWCWAATGNSVANYFGYKQYSQNQFCDMAFGNALSVDCPNNQATLANDQTAFKTIGISAGTYITGTVAFSKVQSEIGSNRPVMTRIVWASGGGHMMTLIGYDASASTVQYHDPWPDDQRINTSTYSWYTSNSEFTWTHSLYGIGA
ncbi:papain-like cysteine protease family protein [Arthrobacter woluwensis]|uniref:Peptidase_C39 like family protein n=1 Tax=Arthrobacter woluwensis TaxID=156980 RepID=A0A1H4NE71_9MICC|nr:papain-like cysteine protease family protein [Arthrobacter woluwensis]SEB92892.1 Peptidase_C39 like family protein [Arthrobacter woluwensis]